MKLQYFEVNAFTAPGLLGNPAGVCPLSKWLPDSLMQKIAAQNNLSETAFFVPTETGFHLRWFTTRSEVDLCGHATMATAHVIINELRQHNNEILFLTKSGELKVSCHNQLYILNFPARPGITKIPDGLDLKLAQGNSIVALHSSRDLMMIFEDQDLVNNYQPDFSEIVKISEYGFIISAPGKDCDFVSRFFLPKDDLPEDPVTGSTHCTLIPYWAKMTGKNSLIARQSSTRGGELKCELQGNRVLIGGHAATYLRGEIEIN